MLKFKRFLKAPTRSFLLLGPRATGKSTWLSDNITASLNIDLLESDRFLEFSARPQLLRDLTAPLKKGEWVIIDEIQKVPGLLDEVHQIYEKKKINFAITGSSARKLKKSHVNLLAGRLLNINFFPLTYPELGDKFDLKSCLNFGCLPAVASDSGYAKALLSSYLSTYIRQELLEESVIRKLVELPRFCRAFPYATFLSIVNLS